MTKQKSTKRALLLSAVSLLLCASMFVGTTFAWFTDTVSSDRNIIQSGNLDVELYYFDDKETDATNQWKKVTADTDVFGYNLWEPGYTKVVKFKVVNEGSLALKYQLTADVFQETTGTNKDGESLTLSNYLYTKVVDKDADRNTILAITGANNLKGSYSMKDMGKLVAKGKEDTTLGTVSEEVIALAIWMPTSVGNEANYKTGTTPPSIEFGINLVATQLTSEDDSFDNMYDEDAVYPALKSVYVPSGTTSATKIQIGEVTVTIPAAANEGTYELKVDNKSVATADGATTVSYDITLYRNGEKASGVLYPVEIEVGTLLDVVSVTHNGTPIAGYTYDAMQGVVSFETDSFSPFAVTYKTIPASNVEFNEDNQIVAGIFEGFNPVSLDATLAEENSEYIVVDFVKDNVTYYVVSERATSVFLSANETDQYVGANSTFNATNVDFRTNQSGQLWTVFNANKPNNIANNEHSTVYLLPGTFNESTVINVNSSVDIIGLGDTDEVKVIKVKGSNSNKHLFNCTGTKSEYIHVTLRNMYLDANANNLNSKGTLYTQNNAAVQAIRKTKVKCYDLTIDKTSNYPFIVNATTAVNNVVYPSYMYVENCSLNGSSVSVYDKSGNFYFYHYGLTTKNGAYTFTSNNNVKNIKMEADDWDW